MRLAVGAGAAATVTARLVAARDVQALLGVVEDTLDLNFAHVCAALRRLALLKRCVLPCPRAATGAALTAVCDPLQRRRGGAV
jgi:hypothetical protein